MQKPKCDYSLTTCGLDWQHNLEALERFGDKKQAIGLTNDSKEAKWNGRGNFWSPCKAREFLWLICRRRNLFLVSMTALSWRQAQVTKGISWLALKAACTKAPTGERPGNLRDWRNARYFLWHSTRPIG